MSTKKVGHLHGMEAGLSLGVADCSRQGGGTILALLVMPLVLMPHSTWRLRPATPSSRSCGHALFGPAKIRPVARPPAGLARLAGRRIVRACRSPDRA
jgi:hypothetical protein